MSEAGTLRLGCVKYLNARPLVHGWPGPVVLDHPAVLCQMLDEGKLDVALVSSFEYLRNPIYSIVDDVAVATHRRAYSVFVAHRENVEQIEEIALDPASRTSVNLLRCLLAERGLQPRLLPDEGGCIITLARARLMIGDQAIAFRQEHEGDCSFWDLGAEWRQATGLPFVFALWLVRPEFNNAGEIADLLRARRDENLRSLDEWVAQQAGFAPEFCSFYFRACLSFRFAETEKEGLWHFRSLCEKHGILTTNPEPLRLV